MNAIRGCTLMSRKVSQNDSHLKTQSSGSWFERIGVRFWVKTGKAYALTWPGCDSNIEGCYHLFADLGVMGSMGSNWQEMCWRKLIYFFTLCNEFKLQKRNIKQNFLQVRFPVGLKIELFLSLNILPQQVFELSTFSLNVFHLKFKPQDGHDITSSLSHENQRKNVR